MDAVTAAAAVKSYRWFSDPGHGWLRVPVEDVRRSGASISRYSYEHDGFAYLEEDCDAGAFLRAAGLEQTARDWPETYRERTPIRGYARYSGGAA